MGNGRFKSVIGGLLFVRAIDVDFAYSSFLFKYMIRTSTTPNLAGGKFAKIWMTPEVA